MSLLNAQVAYQAQLNLTKTSKLEAISSPVFSVKVQDTLKILKAGSKLWKKDKEGKRETNDNFYNL